MDKIKQAIKEIVEDEINKKLKEPLQDERFVKVLEVNIINQLNKVDVSIPHLSNEDNLSIRLFFHDFDIGLNVSIEQLIVEDIEFDPDNIPKLISIFEKLLAIMRDKLPKQYVA